MALTALVKDELSRLHGDQALLPQGRGLGHAAVRGRPAHRGRADRRRGRARHRRPRRGGCGATSPRSSATPATSSCWRRAACGARAGTSSGWCATASPWPARPGCSTGAAGRCGGCRRRWSPVRRATPRPPGAAPSSRTARSPSRAARRRSRSPAQARRRRWRSSVRPAGSGIASKARDVRGVDRVVIRDGDTIGAMLTRLGAHDTVLAWEERRMRREVRATANRLANFDDANLRRSARAAVAAGSRVERAMEILGEEMPEHLRDGRRAPPEAQAGEPGGARPARRPADDQGRGGGPDPAAAGDGRQARVATSASPGPRRTSPPTCSTPEGSRRRPCRRSLARRPDGPVGLPGGSP